MIADAGRRQCLERRIEQLMFLLMWLFGVARGFSAHTVLTRASTEALIELGRVELQKLYPFELDDWQLEAGGAIFSDYNVVVCAPTGAGKTVVGEMALHKCIREPGKAGIYTTPLKALSNEKYRDLCKIFGPADTGLSTGDVSINRGAKVTVMTTEVYRNIAWRSSASLATDDKDVLTKNAVVVLDEFHYMGHPGRGGVWEESVITSPPHTQIVALSATLSNAEALSTWIESVTGRITILVNVPDSKRPVPLRYLFATKDGLFPLFRDPDAGPGAPKGLLGYRKSVSDVSNKQSEKGFGNKSNNTSKNQPKIPRGLRVNPVLINAANKRLQKVERAVERQKARRIQGLLEDDAASEWEEPSPRRQLYQNKRNLSAREERKERERLLKKELRRSVPSLPALVNRLDQKDLLPAIFFIFSRAGCNNAALTVSRYLLGPKDPNGALREEIGQFGDDYPQRRRKTTRQRGNRRDDLLRDATGRAFRPGGDFVSDELLNSIFYDEDDEDKTNIAAENVDSDSPLAPENRKYFVTAGLLNASQVDEVASRISSFNQENEEIAFTDDLSESFLLGIGTHHAALLPAHKTFVEVLFQKQLMKVVFATETLAAGINMPARTTVICSLAKRGNGSSISLLETSNLLQMAGRAGRRGKDTDGTCVIVATPFESHDEAAKILTDEIKPISSQFSPSYSLCVNLIERGEGKLDVARQLVGKSFALWQQSQGEFTGGGGVIAESRELTHQEVFVRVLIDALQGLIEKRSAKFDILRLQTLLETITDPKLSEESLKSFVGITEKQKLESTTLGYLEKELQESELSSDQYAESPDLQTILEEDTQEVRKQVGQQRSRLDFVEKKLRKHPLSAIASVVNSILEDPLSPEARLLSKALEPAVGFMAESDEAIGLNAFQLYAFLKSVDLKKISRPENTSSLASLLESPKAISINSWDEFLSITQTLCAYGCLSQDESGVYKLSSAGIDIGMLGLENSLWCLVAMGAAWDCEGASKRIDILRLQLREFDDLGDPYEKVDEDLSSLPEKETAELLSVLTRMTPSEIAGYVSCLIADSSERGFTFSEQLQKISPLQRQAIQQALLALDRLSEVQRTTSDKSSCVLDVSNCEVVTAWADGCSWNEALEISGIPPGDLARSLSRVLDTLRQLGNLPYRPKRRDKLDGTALQMGIDPSVRKACRDACLLINRYPLKEDFATTTSTDEVDEDDSEDDNTTSSANKTIVLDEGEA